MTFYSIFGGNDKFAEMVRGLDDEDLVDNSHRARNELQDLIADHSKIIGHQDLPRNIENMIVPAEPANSVFDMLFCDGLNKVFGDNLSEDNDHDHEYDHFLATYMERMANNIANNIDQ